MPCTKVQPMADFNWPDSVPDSVILLGGPPGVDHVVREDRMHRSGRDYLVRQAFLRSYQFSVQETFKEKLKRSFIGLNEKVKAIAVEFRNGVNEMVKVLLKEIQKEMSSRQLRISVFRLRLPVSSLAPIQCFLGKRDAVLDD